MLSLSLVYDPPHLLKGVKNNFLEGNVTFSWKKEKQIGCWKDITDLDELDSGDADTRMLNKLTDPHIYKDTIKKMKVKLAAQMFSHRLSGTTRGWLVLLSLNYCTIMLLMFIYITGKNMLR